jgi:hypothetical protein
MMVPNGSIAGTESRLAAIDLIWWLNYRLRQVSEGERIVRSALSQRG